jgi:hypothetical protein|tara:strand:- start:202 stop:486 length:285 start_codon:yes stop_codon:yes gene_type:complete
LSDKWRAAAQAVGAVANITTFTDIDKRYIKPYLAPDTPMKPGDGEGANDATDATTGDGVAVSIPPPPPSPVPAARSLAMADETDDGEMTPVKFE